MTAGSLDGIWRMLGWYVMASPFQDSNEKLERVLEVSKHFPRKGNILNGTGNRSMDGHKEKLL